MKAFEQLGERVLYLNASGFVVLFCFFLMTTDFFFFLFELNVFLGKQVKPFCLLAFS